MKISSGEDVLPAWERLCDPNIRLGEKRQIREDLLAYCGQDTYGMIGLLNLSEINAVHDLLFPPGPGMWRRGLGLSSV